MTPLLSNKPLVLMDNNLSIFFLLEETSEIGSN